MKTAEIHGEPSRIFLFTITSLAFVFFIPLFLLKRIGPVDFWWWFSAVIFILLALIIFFDRHYLSLITKDIKKSTVKKILYGFISAGVLYLLFYFGNFISPRIFPFAHSGIADVYQFKGDSSLLKITLLTTFIIGPGEELFWRGFIQRSYSLRYGEFSGFLITAALYSIIHFGSRNVMLVLAALLCGMFWGLLYRWKRSVLLNAISHIVWSFTVFIILPFNS